MQEELLATRDQNDDRRYGRTGEEPRTYGAPDDDNRFSRAGAGGGYASHARDDDDFGTQGRRQGGYGSRTGGYDTGSYGAARQGGYQASDRGGYQGGYSGPRQDNWDEENSIFGGWDQSERDRQRRYAQDYYGNPSNRYGRGYETGSGAPRAYGVPGSMGNQVSRSGYLGADAEGGVHKGKGPKDYKRSDDRIGDDINDRLTDDSHLDASEITVAVSNGEVTLSGMVSDRQAKRRAEDLADAVGGVSHVQNNLRVSMTGPGYHPGVSGSGQASGSAADQNTQNTWNQNSSFN
jgi:osmotically-inducible protein OsmY